MRNRPLPPSKFARKRGPRDKLPKILVTTDQHMTLAKPNNYQPLDRRSLTGSRNSSIKSGCDS